nr:ligand-binding sensor domain-containing diguanylate cyclase [Acetobacter conturbans]
MYFSSSRKITFQKNNFLCLLLRLWKHAISLFKLNCGALLFFSSIIVCLSQAATAQTLRLFDGQGGLANLAVNIFAQDSDGFLYVGTETGLFVSSGGDFIRQDKPDGTPFLNITAIVENTDGELLLASGEELWLRRENQFKKIDFLGKGKISLVSSGSDFLILDGNGPIKAGGLWRIHHHAARTAFEVTPLIDTYPDNESLLQNPLLNRRLTGILTVNRAIWFACETALCRYDDGRVEVFDTRKGVPEDSWVAFAKANDGTIFARSLKKLVRISANGIVSVENIPFSTPSYFQNHQNSLFLIVAVDGSVLTPGNESLVSRSAAGYWDEMAWPSGLVPQLVTSGFYDRENGVWMNSPGRGIIRLAGYPFWRTFRSNDEIVPERVSSVRYDNLGNLWVAASNGLFKYEWNEKTQKQKKLLLYVNINNLSSLVRTADGAIWAVEKGKGLVRIDPSTSKIRKIPSPNPTTGALLLDSAGRMWIGTFDGIIRLDDPLKTVPYLPRIMALSGRRINQFCFDQFGRLLVLSNDVLFQQKSGEEIFEPRIDVSNFDIGEGHSMAISPSNDILLLGSKGTIRKILLPDDGEPTVSVLDGSPKDGRITTIFRDMRGWIWLAGSQGIDVLTFKGWAHFDSGSGLASSRIITNSISEDEDGSVWIGTEENLVHFINQDFLSPLPNLHTNIVSAQLGKSNILGKSSFWEVGEQNLHIHFVAPTFVDNGNVRYKYKLVGIDNNYNESSYATANYDDLNIKKIIFQVQAFDLLNNRSSSSAVMSAHSAALGGSGSRIIGWAICSVLAFMIVFACIYKKMVGMRQKKIDMAVRGRTRVMEEMQAQLLHQSRIDGLTGLLNRRTSLDELDSLISSGSPRDLIAVALIDIDHFKSINDTLGHQGGDYVLEQYGHRLRQSAGSGTLCGRYGGEELIVIFTSFMSVEDILSRIVKLHEHLREPMRCLEVDITVTCSIGVAVFMSGDTASQLVGRADRALYKGKRKGRNCVVFDQ